MWVIVVIVFWIILSYLAGIGARNKELSFATYFFLSLLLSPVVGLVAMAVAKPGEKKPDFVKTPLNRKE
jgi:hypothetical protein